MFFVIIIAELYSVPKLWSFIDRQFGKKPSVFFVLIFGNNNDNYNVGNVLNRRATQRRHSIFFQTANIAHLRKA